MARTASELIAIAASWVGYHEKATNSQLEDFTANSGNKNWNIFAKKLAEAGYYQAGSSKNGFAWCDIFVDFCFLTLCDGDKAAAEAMECQTGNLGAACPYSAAYYKAKGRLDRIPKPGDQVFFGRDGYEHTGIVERVDDKYIYTIEGNSGDMVKRHTYDQSNSYIKAYGHPFYEGESEETKEPPAPAAEKIETTLVPATTFMLRKNSKGEAVRALQALLNLRGKYGLKTDGDFGPKTETTVKNYQKSRGLSVDGVAGPDTWKSILNNK